MGDSRESRDGERLARRLEGERILVDAADLEVAELLVGVGQSDDAELLESAWQRLPLPEPPRRRSIELAAFAAAAAVVVGGLLGVGALSGAGTGPGPRSPDPTSVRGAMQALAAPDMAPVARLAALQVAGDRERARLVAELDDGS